ncbi:trypsin-like peptidase domain-containing protein, partial [Streptomyces sp. NPDC096311]|uniref:nSTAND1 domain-containing NTPase n=1 Tax=Streptomyces sp. NPDC096311 TaxID=3366083 RepID=UPI00382E091F
MRPERFLVRVLGAGNAPVGVAFVAGEREIVTCAHVVNVALGRDRRVATAPGPAWLHVEFPFAGEAGDSVIRAVRVAAWLPLEGVPFELRDVAGLRLSEELPLGVEAATLISSDDGPAGERRVGVWGPNKGMHGKPRMGNAAGRLMGAYDQVRHQVDGDLRGIFRVQSGYSGGPVWDQSTGQVVGIVQAVPHDREATDVYVIGADLLVETWPEVLYRPPPNPYKGLSAFTEDDSALFFGRERFVAQLVAASDHDPLLVVAGRSGVGKSSVIAAGLVPTLSATGGVRTATFRPGSGALVHLTAAFARAAGARVPLTGSEMKLWRTRIVDEGLATAADYVRAATGASRMLLVIDQFEQLFTHHATEQRSTIIGLLNQLLVEGPDHLRVVLSVRSDFFWDLVESDDPLGGYVQTHALRLLPMSGDDLHLAIAAPARAAGGRHPIEFEDGLAGLIRDDFQGRPGELPLLEFTLTRLWELQRGRMLTLKAYRNLGGVAATLAGHAEDCYAALPRDQQEAAQRIFTELVQADRPDVARQVHRADLRVADWSTVERLGDARLLAISTMQNSDDRVSAETQVVEVAHEAILLGWERLHRWVDTNRDFSAWKTGMVAARQQWVQHERDPELLLRGRRLAAALGMVRSHPEDVNGVAEFIALSKSQADAEQAERHRVADHSDALLWSRRSREALDGGQSALALRSGITSLQRMPTLDGDRVVRRILRLAGRPRGSFRVGGPVRLVVFDAGGSKVLTAGGDGVVRVWGVSDGVEVARFEHGGPVGTAAFGPGGGQVLTAGGDGVVRVWATSGTEVSRFEQDEEIRGVSSGLSGTWAVTADDHGTTRIWDVNGGEEIARFEHGGPVSIAAFGPGGTRVVTADDHGTTRIWDVNGGEEIARFEHGGPVSIAAFGPGGTRVVTADDHGTTRIWDVNGGEVSAFSHQGVVSAAVLSPDEGRLATACGDGTARV